MNTDSHAWIEDVYRRHGHAVLRRARMILGSDAEAQEALHEVFASLLARPEQFTGRGGEIGFLYSATTHHCLNRLRNQRNRMRIVSERVQTSDFHAVDATLEERTRVSQLLARLPEQEAAAVVYYYLDEMSHAEIAPLLGCSRRQVGNILDSARARLERVDRARGEA